MDSQILLRQLLRMPHAYRTLLTPAMRPQARTFALLSTQLPHPRYISVPRILQPSFWTSMIPRPLKERPSSSDRREWNPATPYIILGLLVGSQAIQILWLKQERGRDMRRAEAKIGLLREVIERVQSGEDVDVEKVLGTGDKESEKEWAEVLKEIEDEELLFQSKKQRRALRQAAEEAATKEQAGLKEKTVKEEHNISMKAREGALQESKVKVETLNGAKFC